MGVSDPGTGERRAELLSLVGLVVLLSSAHVGNKSKNIVTLLK